MRLIIISYPGSTKMHLYAPEWSWALAEVSEMPKELHVTHDS